MNLKFQTLCLQNLPQAILLLKQYGQYMYDALGLTAGKTKFYEELASTLLQTYTVAGNLFLLFYLDNVPVGCVGLKHWDEHACEMKRMFVVPGHRGKGLGVLLTREIIKQAKALGYRAILLDTNEEMAAAIELYKKQGFVQIAPYCENENRNVIYLKKVL